MARTDNLNNFLTDVAQSIRNKKGTNNTIKASDFDTEIASIETGGGGFEEYFNPIVDTVNNYPTSQVPKYILQLPDINLTHKGTLLAYGLAGLTNCQKIGKITTSANTTNYSNFLDMFARDTTTHETIDLSGLGKNSTTILAYFLQASNIKYVDLSDFDHSKITSYQNLLYTSKVEEVNFGEDTELMLSNSVESRGMFASCQNLKTIHGILNFSGYTRTYMSSLSNSHPFYYQVGNVLENVKIKNVGVSINLLNCSNLSAESVDYLLNNVQDVTASPKTITLHANAKARASVEAIAHAESLGWTIV